MITQNFMASVMITQNFRASVMITQKFIQAFKMMCNHLIG